MNEILMQGFVEKIAESFQTKEALAKWKKMLFAGKLSGANKKKLLKEYIDHDKMIKGLNTGSENIIKRHGGKAVQTSFSDRVRAISRGELPLDTLAMPAFTDSGSKTVHMPKGIFYNIFNPFRKKMSRPRSRQNRYIDAVTKRHEADEMRVGAQQVKRHGYSRTWKPHKRVVHRSPEVVARESEHIMLAPGAVRRKFTRSRKRLEAPYLSSAGLEYGNKSVPRGKRRKGMESLIDNQDTNLYGE